MTDRKPRILVLFCLVSMVAVASIALIEFEVTVLQSPRPDSGGLFGYGVSGAGDYNNDGYDDLLIGAPREDGPAAGAHGTAYIFSGASGTILDTLDSPLPQISSWYGEFVQGAGDLNGDNYGDVMVAAPLDGYNDYNGVVYVFSGASGDTLFVLGSPNSETGSTFGSALGEAGDVNNDGTPDIIIGAPLECPDSVFSAGRAYVFSGMDGGLLYTLEPDYPAADGNFGVSVSGLGDLNDDGHADFVVGAHGETVGGEFIAGRVYVYSGLTGDTLYTIGALAPQNGGHFGDAVENAGDLNNDGKSELVVGSTDADYLGMLWVGRVYIFDGVNGALIRTLDSTSPVSRGDFGYPISVVNDIDGDGLDEILVGAVGESVGGFTRAGRAYLFNSVTGDTIATFVHPEPDFNKNFGSPSSGIGDINNDDLGDLLIGSPNDNAGGITQAGQVFLYASGDLAVGIPVVGNNLPTSFELNQNYPNPFNPTTTINYSLPEDSWVTLKLFDLLGREVMSIVDEAKRSGYHRVVLDGGAIASGLYLYRIQADRFTDTKKLILLK